MNSDDLYIDLADEANERDPQEYPFGIFVRDSSSLDLTALFFWFQSMRELLDFLIEVVPAIYGLDPRDEPADHQRIKEALREATSDVTGNKVPDAVEIKICQIVEPYFHLIWIGTFNDLCDSQEPFPLDIRKDFFEHTFGEDFKGNRKRAVKKSEVAEFAPFVMAYGT